MPDPHIPDVTAQPQERGSRSRPWQNPTSLEGYTPDWAGQFDSHSAWVNHASRALTGHPSSIGPDLPSVCIDAKGRRCWCGKDFARARDEDAFPVRYFWEFRASTDTDPDGAGRGEG